MFMHVSQCCHVSSFWCCSLLWGGSFFPKKCFTHRLVLRAAILHVVQMLFCTKVLLPLKLLMGLSSPLCIDAQKKRIVFQVTLSNHSLNAWKLSTSHRGQMKASMHSHSKKEVHPISVTKSYDSWQIIWFIQGFIMRLIKPQMNNNP